MSEMRRLVGQVEQSLEPEGAAPTFSEATRQFAVVQALHAVLDRTEQAEIRAFGDTAVNALLAVLGTDTCAPVRRAVLMCLSTVFQRDPVRASLAHSSVLDPLTLKSQLPSSQAVVIGYFEVLALHARLFGRINVGQVSKTVECIKAMCKARSSSLGVRCAAMVALCSVVSGIGMLTASGPSSYQGSKLKALRTTLKDCSTVALAHAWSAMPALRAAAFDVLSRLAEVGAHHLWESKCWQWSSEAALCKKALEDASADVGVRRACSHTLSALAVAPTSPPALEYSAELDEKAGGLKVADTAVAFCLEQPFARAAASQNREVAQLLAVAWARGLRVQQIMYQRTEADTVAAALGVIDSLASLPAPTGTQLGHSVATGEQPHAQACLLSIMQSAVLPSLSEGTLRDLLDRLGDRCRALLESPEPNVQRGVFGAAKAEAGSGLATSRVPQAAVLLYTMSHVLDLLQEVSAESAGKLRDAVHALLMASSTAIGYAAAGVLGQLATAEGSSASRLMMEYMSMVKLQTAMLGSQAGGSYDTAYGASSTGWQEAMQNLQGCVLAMCALQGAVSIMPLGCPSSHLQEMYGMAVRMIEEPHSLGDTRSTERRLGCLVLSCLSCNLPLPMLEVCEDQMLTCLTVDAFGETGRAAMDLSLYKQKDVREREDAFLREAGWRCAALEACKSWLTGYVAMLPDAARRRTLSKAVSTSLRPLLALVCESPALQGSLKAGGSDRMAAGATMFLQGLLDVYLCLPSTSVLLQDHEALTQLCMLPLTAPPAHYSMDTAVAVDLGLLASLLNPQDSVLALQLPGTLQTAPLMALSPVDEELARFGGYPGGAHPATWQLRPDVQTHSGQRARDPAHVRPIFSQPCSIASGVVTTQVKLLGRLLTVVGAADQLQLLDSMTTALADVPPAVKGRKPLDPALAMRLVCVSGALLIGLSAVATLCKQSGKRSSLVASSAEALGLSLLTAGATRPGAEVLSYAALIGGDAAAACTVHMCCEQLTRQILETGSGVTGWALVLGAVYRSVGGIALQSLLPQSVGTLISLASKTTADHGEQVRALHSLCLVAHAAFNYTPYMHNTLGVAMQQLLRTTVDGPAVRPVVASLVNAMVELQGPEFSRQASTFPICQSIMTEMAAPNLTGSWALDWEETTVKRHLVLYATQIVLFAPDAVPTQQQLPMLGAMLGSRRTQLRHAAAASLRHLSECNPEALVEEHMERVLVAAIDCERDPAVTALLASTIQSMVLAGGRARPGPWVHSLGGLLQGSVEWRCGGGGGDGGGVSAPATPPRQPLQREESGLAEQGDSPEGEESVAAAADAGRPAGPGSVGLDARAVDQDWEQVPQLVAPGLSAKTVVLDALLRLVDALDTDAQHAPGGTGHRDSPLLEHVHVLVRCSFAIVEGRAGGLKVRALEMLGKLLRMFQAVEDANLEDGTRVMELYVAAYVTAVKGALKGSADALVSAQGALLAGDLMRSGVLANDPQSAQALVSRLSDRVASFEADDDLNRSQYAEWVGVRVRVTLLHGLAQCYLAGTQETAGQEMRDATSAPVLQHAEQILTWWRTLCLDAALLQQESPAVYQAHKSALLPSLSLFTTSKISSCLFSALPSTLQAASSLLSHLCAVGNAANASASARLSVAAPLPAPADTQALPAGCTATFSRLAEVAQMQLTTTLVTLGCAAGANVELAPGHAGAQAPVASAQAHMLACLANTRSAFATLDTLLSPDVQRSGACPLEEMAETIAAVLSTLDLHLPPAARELQQSVLASAAGAEAQGAATHKARCMHRAALHTLLHCAASLLLVLASAPAVAYRRAGAEPDSASKPAAAGAPPPFAVLAAVQSVPGQACSVPLHLSSQLASLIALVADLATHAANHAGGAAGAAPVDAPSTLAAEAAREGSACAAACVSACDTLLRGLAENAAGEGASRLPDTPAASVLLHVCFAQLETCGDADSVVLAAVQAALCDAGSGVARVCEALQGQATEGPAACALHRQLLEGLEAAHALEPSLCAAGPAALRRHTALAKGMLRMSACASSLCTGAATAKVTSAACALGVAPLVAMCDALCRRRQQGAPEQSPALETLKAALQCLRVSVKQGALDALGLALLREVPASAARMAAELLRQPHAGDEDLVNTVWAVLLTLATLSDGAVQQALLSAAIALIVDALCPHIGGAAAADPRLAALALALFQGRISAGALAPASRSVMQGLSGPAKDRLRSGVAHAQASAKAAAAAAVAGAPSGKGPGHAAVKLDLSQFKVAT